MLGARADQHGLAKLPLVGAQAIHQILEHEVPHEICGKLVVATSEEELPRLDELLRRGAANGLTGLRRVGPEEMKRIEPHAAGLAAARTRRTAAWPTS